MINEGSVLVPRCYLADLVERDILLDCLERYGVDNWPGYSEIWEDYRKYIKAFNHDNSYGIILEEDDE